MIKYKCLKQDARRTESSHAIIIQHAYNFFSRKTT